MGAAAPLRLSWVEGGWASESAPNAGDACGVYSHPTLPNDFKLGAS